MSRLAVGRNPDLKCIRVRPACGHKQAEHALGHCFGVVMISGLAIDCRCDGFLEPQDREPIGRQQAPP